MRYAVLGSKGLVGEAFTRNLSGVELAISRDDINFMNTRELELTLKTYQIDTVINAAAKVGGINLNRLYPYDMYSANIALANSILDASIKAGVTDLVQFCSNCSYPFTAQQPYKEECLFDGLPHKLNRGYAAAKLASVQAGQCAEDQGLIRVYHPIPCSLFGLHDNYRLDDSHFVAAVIRKVSEAVMLKSKSIEFWGSGAPFREFMFADDLVSAIVILLNLRHSYQPINIGPGIDTPIKEVVTLISKHAAFTGVIQWDDSKPDGAMHKLLNSTQIASMGWKPSYTLADSLFSTYNYFQENQKDLRL